MLTPARQMETYRENTVCLKAVLGGRYRVCGYFSFPPMIYYEIFKQRSSKISVINSISCAVLIFYHLHSIFLCIQMHIFSEPLERKLQT